MRRIPVLATVLVVMALLAAACGGAGDPAAVETSDARPAPDSQPDPEPEPEPAAPARGISEDGVVKVGTWIAQSGPLSIAGSIADAWRLRLELANEEGGVNGYTFDFEAVDDQADPSQTIAAIRDLWENDEVFVILHPYGSGTNAAAKDYVLQNDVPVLFPFADARIYLPPGEPPPPNVFGLIPPYGEQIAQLVEYAVEHDGVQTLAVFHTNDPLGEAGRDGIRAIVEQLDGVELVEEVGYDSTETNFAPLGRRLAQSNADAVLVWAFAGSLQIMQSTMESGWDGVWLLHDGFRGGFFLDQLRALPFDMADRTLMNIYWRPPDGTDPEVQEYVDAYSERFPDGDIVIGQPGWIAASIFLEAVRQATADGTPLTWEALRDTLESWDDVDIDGAVGLTYTPENHYGLSRALVRRFDGQDWQTVQDWELMPGFRS
jgi:branched-chain amino acid transport system substrate-binding protein